ncbi:MAG: outer membrane protein assembly factor BamE [Rhodoferax sp.]|nr:outer membrane protein assembly factor BamE [Rhodoferax sp.]
MTAALLRPSRLGLALLVTASLTACSTVDSASNRVVAMVTPYRMDIVQGNFVSREQVSALQPGMSRLQVRDILGTPLVTSLFHADRWDYVFTFRRTGAEPQLRKVTVFFRGDALERVQADALPSEAEFVASLDSGRRFGKVPVLEVPADQLPPPPARPVVAPVTSTTPLAPASYPPLEAP